MFEAYKIGVTLSLRDEIGLKLAEMSKQFAKLDLQISNISKNLNAIGREALGMSAVARESTKAASAMERAVSASGRLNRNLKEVAVTSGASGGRGFNGVHGGNVHLGKNGLGVSALGFATSPAFAAGFLGAGAIGYGAHRSYDAAKEYEITQARLAMLGMTPEQNAAARRFTENLSTYGVSRNERLRLFTEAQGIFRESSHSGEEALDHAKVVTPMLAKIAFASEALNPEIGSKLKIENKSMLRFIEQMQGLKSPERFNEIANAGFKAAQSSGGVIDWEQMRQFVARGGSAVYGLSDEALYGKLEPIIGEMKGSSAGNAMLTAYNRLTNIVKLPNQVLHKLVDRGIYDKNSVVFNKNGTLKTTNGDSLSKEKLELLSKDPVEFYRKYVMPAQAGMSEAQIYRDNALIFGREGGKFYSQIYRMGSTIDKSVGAWRTAKNVDEAGDILKGTAEGKEKQFDAALADLKVTVGKDILPRITKFLEGLTDFLQSLDKNWETISKVISPDWKNLIPGVAQFKLIKGIFDLGSNKDSNINPVASEKSQPIQVSTTVTMQNEIIARIVSNHMAKQASKPTASSSLFDPNQSFTQPNMPYLK